MNPAPESYSIKELGTSSFNQRKEIKSLTVLIIFIFFFNWEAFQDGVDTRQPTTLLLSSCASPEKKKKNEQT